MNWLGWGCGGYNKLTLTGQATSLHASHRRGGLPWTCAGGPGMDISQGRGIKNPRLTTVVILTWRDRDWRHAGDPGRLANRTACLWNGKRCRGGTWTNIASRSWMGQSPYPGLRGQNPLSVGPP